MRYPTVLILSSQFVPFVAWRSDPARSGNILDWGIYVSAAVQGHSLESGAVHNSHKIQPEAGILHDAVASVPPEGFGSHPNWPSQEIMPASVFGAMDLYLVLGEAAVVFVTNFGVTGRTIATPASCPYLVLRRDTVCGIFERLQGHRSRQLSLLAERFEPALER